MKNIEIKPENIVNMDKYLELGIYFSLIFLSVWIVAIFIKLFFVYLRERKEEVKNNK